MVTASSTAKAPALGMLGAASGAVAWMAIDLARWLGVEPADDFGGVQLGVLPLAPGLAFGVIVGGYLAARARLARERLAAYALASTLAYLAAYHVAYHLLVTTRLDGIDGLIATGMAAGLCGSLLLACATLPLLAVSAAALRLSVAVGAIAGALLPLFTATDVAGIPLGPLAFFVLWQGAYAASLAPVLAARS